jgi:predicted RNase H-like HicB family nuclease
MKLHAVIHQAEEGGYWAEVPALPGCVTQAETMPELERNLHEAVEGWLLAVEPQEAPEAGLLLALAVRRSSTATRWPSAEGAKVVALFQRERS